MSGKNNAAKDACKPDDDLKGEKRLEANEKENNDGLTNRYAIKKK